MVNKKELLILTLILFIAAFLRFYNLMHDAPYFFNPDERNMAIAISQFRLPSKLSQIPICLISQLQLTTHNTSTPLSTSPQLTTNCNLNPHFFAYGQFPLYLAYISDQIVNHLGGVMASSASWRIQPATPEVKKVPQLTINNYLSTPFPSAIFWLRFWSALSSIGTVFLVFLITRQLLTFNGSTEFAKVFGLLTSIVAAFTPGLIQAAHFGTTESLLTFFFLASLYLSLSYLSLSRVKSRDNLSQARYLILLSLVVGLALGSKLTGLVFLIPPFLSLMTQAIKLSTKRGTRRKKIIRLLLACRQAGVIGLLLIFGTLLFFLLSSPYNLVDFAGFKGSAFGYEAEVATGKYQAFYTRQFVDTIPILFQIEKIFPYALGWPIFILGALGFLLITLNLSLRAFFFVAKQYQKSKIKNQKYIEKIKKIVKIFAQQNKIFVDCTRNRIPRLRIVERFMIIVRGLWTMPPRNLDTLQARKFCLRAKIDNERDLFIIILFSFLIYLIPNAFLFAKWTRFMTPIFPFFSIFAAYGVKQIYQVINTLAGKSQKSNIELINNWKLGYWVIGLLVFISLLPGIAFMSIYTHEDSRVTASKWIYQNIPNTSYVLSETANVVDIPLSITNYQLPIANYTVISFDFYHTDENPALFRDLITHLEKSDYIFIPSRRIFANYLRLPKTYPLVTKYYQLLFSGRLGFEKVIEISSFPKLTINHYSLTIPDEEAEETFTVFDHPVIRIYHKVKPLTKEEYRSLFTK